MKYFLIGIAGSAMSGLADILRSQGHEVQGSDLTLGGHKAEHITQDIERIVYTPAITPQSVGWLELEAARRLGIESLRLDEILGELTQDAKLIAITGTHGKSSTTAMVAHILEEAGFDPTVLLGAPVPKWHGKNYRVGRDDFWVLEADEYKRKFLQLKPRVAVITNIEFDHPDSFKDFDDVKSAFAEFVSRIKAGGTLIVHESAELRIKNRELRINLIEYGKNHLQNNPNVLPKLKVIGDFQRLNATAAVLAAEVAGVKREDALKYIAQFSGAGRRLEYIGNKDGVMVYDDYGHHPTEVRVTLKALKAHFPKKRLVVAFQPHHQGRLQSLFDEFSRAFASADRLLLTEVYVVPGRSEKVTVSGQDLAQAIEAHGVDVRFVGGLSDLRNVLHQELRPGDVFLTMGATDITKIGREWIGNTSP